MIKNANILKKLENEIIRGQKPDFFKNVKIVEELHKEALDLGIFRKNSLDGIDVDIRIAKAINNVGKTS